MGIDEYGYGKGLLSNSMVQTAQFCTHKFKGLYVGERAITDGPAMVGATTMGSLVHKALEEMPDRERVVSVYYDEAARYLGVEADEIRGLVQQTYMAIDATMVYGKRQGKTYVAPEMTNYWKQNYRHIDEQWMERQLGLGDDFNWDISLQDFLCGAYRCIQTELASPSFDPGDWDSVEQEKLVVGEVFGAKMVGTIDLLLVRGSEVRMIDYKTGRKKWDAVDVRNADQFCLYTELLEQNGVLEGGKRLTVGVRDLRNDELVLVVPGVTEMTRWADRYKQKVKTALAAMQDGAEDEVIAFGSGFHPGCPCELAPVCPYVVE